MFWELNEPHLELFLRSRRRLGGRRRLGKRKRRVVRMLANLRDEGTGTQRERNECPHCAMRYVNSPVEPDVDVANLMEKSHLAPFSPSLAWPLTNLVGLERRPVGVRRINKREGRGGGRKKNTRRGESRRRCPPPRSRRCRLRAQPRSDVPL